MAAMVMNNNGFGLPINFRNIEGPLVELDRWNFAELLLLNQIKGIPYQIGDINAIDLCDARGDIATLVQTVDPEIMEIVFARRLKPWVRPEDPRIKDAIKEAQATYPGIFIFMLDQELRQVNISSMIYLARQPTVDSVEFIKRRWQQAAKLYRTDLARVVTPFRPAAYR